MFNAALRCIEEDYPVLLKLVQFIGAIQIVDGAVIPVNGSAWDYLGYKLVGPIPEEGKPDTRTILCDAKGNKYVHINIRTMFSIIQAIAKADAANPDIAVAKANLGRFFILDAEGNEGIPEFPMQVFL